MSFAPYSGPEWTRRVAEAATGQRFTAVRSGESLLWRSTIEILACYRRCRLPGSERSPLIRYTTLDRIGIGYFASIYQSSDNYSKNRVAIKVFPAIYLFQFCTQYCLSCHGRLFLPTLLSWLLGKCYCRGLHLVPLVQIAN